jgi:hypothetical protein
MGSAASTKIKQSTLRGDTASLSSRNQRYAVLGCTPCASAHSLKFTHALHHTLKCQQLFTPLQAGAPINACGLSI